jgi:hypothetical protein
MSASHKLANALSQPVYAMRRSYAARKVVKDSTWKQSVSARLRQAFIGKNSGKEGTKSKQRLTNARP